MVHVPSRMEHEETTFAMRTSDARIPSSSPPVTWDEFLHKVATSHGSPVEHPHAVASVRRCYDDIYDTTQRADVAHAVVVACDLLRTPGRRWKLGHGVRCSPAYDDDA